MRLGVEVDILIESNMKRLLIPYFIYGLCFMLPIKYVGNFYTYDNFAQAVRNFLAGKESGHLWFLAALFWCTVSFTLILTFLLRNNADSVYILLIVSEGISLMHDCIPIDIFGLHRGLDYIFWFSLGYVFERRRRFYDSWSLKKVTGLFLLLTIASIFAGKYQLFIEARFFVVLRGITLTYLSAIICSRLFTSFTNTVLRHLLVHNSFYIYLFHDPLEYVVLRIFMNREYMTHSSGVVMYVFSRSILVLVVSIILGELITTLRRKINVC